jgi:uncharacterized protein
MTKSRRRFLWSVIVLVVMALVAGRWWMVRSKRLAFFDAAERGDRVMVERALDRGRDVNAIHSYLDGLMKGEPLRVTETALYLAAREGHAEVVQLLLARGADPNIRCTLGKTPLISVAMVGGNEAIVRHLLDAGADVSFVGGNLAFPRPALGWAVGRSDYPTFRLLLTATREQGHLGRLLPAALSELQWRSERSLNGRVAKALTASYRDGTIMAAAARGDTAMLLELLPSVSGATGPADEDGWTPLHWSAGFEGSVEDVRLLLAYGADPNARTLNGYTPLMAAAEAGDTEKISLLLEAGARVDAFDDKGDTALHAACKHASEDLVVLLLNAGADARIPALDGTTPSDLARMRAQRSGEDLRELVRARAMEATEPDG